MLIPKSIIVGITNINRLLDLTPTELDSVFDDPAV